MTYLPSIAPARRWFRPPPAPTVTTPISARRAYLEVLGVFSAFFAAGIVAAGYDLASPTTAQPNDPWSTALPSAVNDLATLGLCIVVPVLVAGRRGRPPTDLGLTRPGPGGISQWMRIAGWAVLALAVGLLVTAALATSSAPPGTLDTPDLVFSLVHALQAGPIEEIVVLAFTVTTLEQAGRSRPEIIAVALVLRSSYHIYYGLGVLGMPIWGAVFLWLFWRFRAIVPLIIVHSTYDVFATLSNRWHAVAGVEVLLFIALWITSFVLWLVWRSERSAQPAAGGGWMPAQPGTAPPGWYPDPGGSATWLWFDGYRWTPHRWPPAPGPQSAGATTQ